jgi:hypothetical protein
VVESLAKQQKNCNRIFFDRFSSSFRISTQRFLFFLEIQFINRNFVRVSNVGYYVKLVFLAPRLLVIVAFLHHPFFDGVFFLRKEEEHRGERRRKLFFNFDFLNRPAIDQRKQKCYGGHENRGKTTWNIA